MASAGGSGTSDETVEIFCDPCKTGDENITAVSYCEECNEYLCRHCHKAHGRLAATRYHVVKEQNDMPKTKVNKTDMLEKCFAHEYRVIDHYCFTHEELCCPLCLAESHKSCENVKSVAEFLEQIDIEQQQRDMESNIRELADDADKTMYLVKKSLNAIENNHTVSQYDMLKAKNDTFEHIENIYGKLNNELGKIREDELKKVLPCKNKCQAITFDIKTLKSYFKDKKICDKYQLFFAMKKAEVKIKSNLDDLNEIKSKCLDVKRYCFKPDSGIMNMKTQPVSFGSFHGLSSSKLPYRVHTLRACDADEESVCCVTGIAVLSKTRLILADNENASIKVVDTEEDKIISKVKFESAPWDVTVIPREQIAVVTVPGTETLSFLSVTENTTLKHLPQKCIKLNGRCYGITSSNNTLIVTVTLINNKRKSATLEEYNFEGKLLTSVKLDAIFPQHVVLNTNASTLYISDYTSDSRIEEFSCQKFEKIATIASCKAKVVGMALDTTGVLYYMYCDAFYHGIDYVFIDEKHKREKKRLQLILESKPRPNCIAFCNETDRLYVGKDGNDIDVYIIL